MAHSVLKTQEEDSDMSLFVEKMRVKHLRGRELEAKKVEDSQSSCKDTKHPEQDIKLR